MSAKQQSEKKGSIGKVGNHTQENHRVTVECPDFRFDTTVRTPSVGLSTCDNDDCDVRAFVLNSTEKDKYGR